ncbi:MAG TPA: hypothetical protein VIN58_13205 [Roseateles sp.]
MSAAFKLFGERSLTLVAATFHDGHSASRAVDALRQRLTRKLGIFLITPRDRRLGRKMEPESHGISRTLLRSHVWLGLAGAGLGLVAAAAGLVAGWPAALASPRVMLAFGTVYGGLIGLLAGGLLTLRPDRARVINQVREASERGRWSVVSHPTSRRDAKLARELLARGGGQVLRSL